MSETEKIICSCCGCELAEDDDWQEDCDGNIVCRECLDNEYFLCECCGDYVLNDYCNTTGNDDFVCDMCLEENYTFCNCCEQYYPNDGGFTYVDREDGYVCDECIERHYSRCDVCDELVHNDDLEWDDDEDMNICTRCMDMRRSRKIIHGYGFKPAPKFKIGHVHDAFDDDENIKEIVMGVELEVDKGHDAEGLAAKICDACEDIYCKHDGSLEYGVEIVTHPCTLDYHLNELGWDKVVKLARESRFLSHDARTCGLHVHVGRRQLGETDSERDKTIAKIIWLVSRHWNNIKAFSRRTDKQLSEWAHSPELEENYAKGKSTKKLTNEALWLEEDGRYQAVNLCNRNTIEFRLFNGTLNLNTIKATLEFVSNICNYAKSVDFAEVFSSQWADITGYRKYPELETYLVKRGIKNVETIPDLGWSEPMFALLEKGKIENGSFVMLKPKMCVGEDEAAKSKIAIVVNIDGSDALVSFGARIPGYTHDTWGGKYSHTYRWLPVSDLMLVSDAVIKGDAPTFTYDEKGIALGMPVRINEGRYKGRVGRISLTACEIDNPFKDNPLYGVQLDGIDETFGDRAHSTGIRYNYLDIEPEYKAGDKVLLRDDSNLISRGLIGRPGIVEIDDGYMVGVNFPDAKALEIDGSELYGVLTDNSGFEILKSNLIFAYPNEYSFEVTNESESFKKGQIVEMHLGGDVYEAKIEKVHENKFRYTVSFGARSERVGYYFFNFNLEEGTAETVRGNLHELGTLTGHNRFSYIPKEVNRQTVISDGAAVFDPRYNWAEPITINVHEDNIVLDF